MNYGLVEEEIAQRINSKFADLNKSEDFFAAPMPDTEKEIRDFDKEIEKGRVAVEYIDSDFSPTSGLGAVRQEETARFRLFFSARKMRGENGLFSMIDFVKKFLVGYQPTNGDPLTIIAYGKQEYEPGIWVPFLDFATKTIYNQAEANEPTTGGPLSNFLS